MAKNIKAKKLVLYTSITAIIMIAGVMVIKPLIKNSINQEGICCFEKVDNLDTLLLDYLVEHPIMNKYSYGRDRVVLDCIHGDNNSKKETIEVTVVYNIEKNAISRETNNSSEANQLKTDTYKLLNRGGVPVDVEFYTQIEV